MFGTWDIVRPRYWHPLASLEQSMMEFDEMADRMFTRHSRFPFHDDDDTGTDHNFDRDYDDFFRDLPVRGRRLQQQPHADRQQTPVLNGQCDTKTKSPEAQPRETQSPKQGGVQPHHNEPRGQEEEEEGQQRADRQSQQQSQQQEQQALQPQHPHTAFSTYSFSNSSVVDDKGRRVVSTRRRYEDSSGRLKALHERQIEGKTHRAMWNRLHKDDAGRHETLCSSGTTPDEFEQVWKTTPFGEAHERHRLEQQQQQQQIQE